MSTQTTPQATNTVHAAWAPAAPSKYPTTYIAGYSAPTIVGHVTIPAGTEHTRYGSYAADYDTMAVEPGIYPIVATYRYSEVPDADGNRHLRTEPDHYHVLLTGTITSHYAWQGEAHGARKGQPTTHTVTTYGYQALNLAAILRGVVTVADGFAIVQTLSERHHSIVAV